MATDGLQRESFRHARIQCSGPGGFTQDPRGTRGMARLCVRQPFTSVLRLVSRGIAQASWMHHFIKTSSRAAGSGELRNKDTYQSGW